jgi:uncharacterized protein YcbX
MSEIVIGRVSSILRYPLKSMLGEELETVAFDQRGVVGDRRYALIDDETGKVVSVKRPRWWGRMFELTGRTSGDAGAVVSFPDGETVPVGDPKLSVRLGEFFGRPVTVADGDGFVETGTLYPCAGVYADVLAEGEIRRGDPVRIID